MNLVCFPHYTCGGLLCDIFGKEFSSLESQGTALGQGAIHSANHSLGKIGDNDTVFDNYDSQKFLQEIKSLDLAPDAWIGSHCWPKREIISAFDRIVCVTTSSYRSKLYRWARCYYHYYQPSLPWQGLQGMDLVDKARETAKNYLRPFVPVSAHNVTNIEFSEIVEISPRFRHILEGLEFEAHLERWQTTNHFLYAADFWTSAPAERLYEAEIETNLNVVYEYQ